MCALICTAMHDTSLQRYALLPAAATSLLMPLSPTDENEDYALPQPEDRNEWHSSIYTEENLEAHLEIWGK